MATKAQPIEIDALISLEEAGRLLGLSAERIRVLVKAGLIDRPQPGRVVLSSVARGYARYWQDKASQETKTSADSRVRDARAREIEMRNDERMRKLIPIEDATAVLDFLSGVVNEQLNSLPAQITRDIPLRREIEAKVNGAKAEIAKALRSSTDVARKGGDLPHSGADS